MARNDLMVLSYVWYKWKRKKDKLYSRSRNQFFDIAGNGEEIDQVLYNIPDLEKVTVEVPCWKLAVVLNDQLMYQGPNPLGFDDCPFIAIVWNYEPHINYYDLRARGLVRTMRDSNYLLNRRIIINHDITEATINAGWKRKIGAVGNEDNLKRSGQGWDIIVNEGYELTDVEKIQPSGVPESDMALADQLRSLIFGTSGVDLENWSAQGDKQSSSLTTLLKQAANLTVLQKYFDQWDYAKKLVYERCLQIVLNNWNADKIKLIVGEEPSPFFYSKIYSRFQTIVEEGELTPTQQNMQAQSRLDINAAFGREVFPPSMIVPYLNITGKKQAIEFLQQQEQAAQAAQQQSQNIQHAFEEAKLKELYARATAQIATARERHGRAESNIGLLEERLSEISKNQSLSIKAKAEAVAALLENVAMFGNLEAQAKMREVEQMGALEDFRENEERAEAKAASDANKFATSILGGGMQQQEQPQQPMQQSMQQSPMQQ